MSEFQDFLTRHIAYVTIGQFKAGRFDEARQLYDEAVSTYHDGFQGAWLLQEEGTDRGISVIFWDNEESMEANLSDAHRAVLKKMMPLFATPPATTRYEVVSEVRPPRE